jgi:hypothetical protein
MLNTSTDGVFNMNETQVNATLDAWLKKEEPSKEVHRFNAHLGGENIAFFDQYSNLGGRSSEPSVIEARFAPMVAPA